MMGADLCPSGWIRDIPDHRDYTRHTTRVRKMLHRLRHPEANPPSSVDWREYCLPVQDQLDIAASCAHACIALVQYFERRSTGRVLQPSRLFLHANALRLSQCNGLGAAASLRVTLKSMIKFGLPPERFWPYDPAALDRECDPFLYSFNREYSNLRYVRLDESIQSGSQTLTNVKSFLAAGFACVLGVGIPSSLTNEPEIPYPSRFDSIRTGHAVMVIGYDDSLRIRSERGALLVRSSWGTTWGMEGNGWLPYRYVTDHLAGDVWTVLRSQWLRSDEFRQPL
jgi:C1A family cysteine protease